LINLTRFTPKVAPCLTFESLPTRGLDLWAGFVDTLTPRKTTMAADHPHPGRQLLTEEMVWMRDHARILTCWGRKKSVGIPAATAQLSEDQYKFCVTAIADSGITYFLFCYSTSSQVTD
jgi:hypothetical protein